jgi:hypothetical protein
MRCQAVEGQHCPDRRRPRGHRTLDRRAHTGRWIAAAAFALLCARPSVAPPVESAEDECYHDVARGRHPLARCAPDAAKLLEAVADVSSSLASGSLAEVWLRMGTRLHDIATAPPDAAIGSPSEYTTAVRCLSTGPAAPAWAPVLQHSRRCILTAMRLLVDAAEAPRPGTHAGLSMGRALMHPCAIPSSPSSSVPAGASAQGYLGNRRPRIAAADVHAVYATA